MVKGINTFVLRRGLYTSEDTVNLPDIEGKIVVLAPRYLKEQYQTPGNQLVLAQGGFGCKEGARGQAVFGIALGDGDKARWERHQFIGALKESLITPEIKMQLLKVEALPEGHTLPTIKLGFASYEGLKARLNNNEVLTPRQQFAWLCYKETEALKLAPFINIDGVPAVVYVNAMKRFLQGMRAPYAFGQAPDIKDPASHFHALQAVIPEVAERAGIDEALLMLLSSVGFEYGAMNVVKKPDEYGLRKGKVR